MKVSKSKKNSTLQVDLGETLNLTKASEAYELLKTNYKEQDWFLHLECFDPHEPFAAPDRFRSKSINGSQQEYTWPQYRKSSDDTDEEIAEIKENYAALIRFCDEQLGRMLDFIDEKEMWNDTTIILTTDHGFMLGEHDWWGKLRMPFFNEIANIPLFIHDATTPNSWGTRINQLTQTTDISATILDLYNLSPCNYSTGKSILPLIRKKNESSREVALYGIFGGSINATDGEFTYFLYPKPSSEEKLHEYTLMPMHSTSMFEIKELENEIGKELDSQMALNMGLVTFSFDDIDWEDEVRIFLEERSSFSPDSMTGLEANLRFAGPETMETKIFGRLTAWQNWIFQRPNAVGEEGALKKYGSGNRSKFNWERV